MSATRLLRVGRRSLVWIGLLALSFLFWTYHERWGISQGTILSATVIALFFYVTYIHNDLSEKFGLNEYPSAKWVQNLLHGQPIEPTHERSQGIPRDGWGISEKDHVFFENSEDFANDMNQRFSTLDEPWRLQEQAKTEVGQLGDDGPVYGRQYRIFFNEQMTGRVRLRAKFNYSAECQNVDAVISIENARLLPFNAVVDLLDLLIDRLSTDPSAHEEAKQRMLFAMMAAVWNTGPEAIRNPDLEVRLQSVVAG
jgi:hypothetical protein